MERASRLGSNYYKSAENSSKRLTNYINQNTNAFNGLNRNIQVTTNTLKTFAGAFIGGFAVSGIVNVADNYGQMAQRIRNSLQSVEGDISNYEMVQNRLLETSIRNAKDLADSQELYIRSAESMKDLGYSTSQTLDFVESLSSAFTSNATSSDKVKSSIDALNKAFVSGKVSGDQWRTLSAALPNLAGELAKSTGKSRDEIVKLGNAGKLSTVQLANGTIQAKDAFNTLADSMDNTVKDGFVQLSNAFQHWVGEANQTHKVTATIVQGMTYLAKNFDIVVNAGSALVALSLARYFGNLTNSIVASASASAKDAIEKRAQAMAQKEVLTVTLASTQAEKQFLITTQTSLASQLKLAQTEKARISIRNQMKANSAQIIALDKAEIATKIQLATATTRASTASIALNRAQGLLKSGLGLLGGPAGLLFLVAGGIASLAMNADNASPNMRDYAKSIDDIKKSLEGLNLVQLDSKRASLEDEAKAFGEEIKEIEKQVRNYTNVLNVLNNPANYSAEDNMYASSFGDVETVVNKLAKANGNLYEKQQKLKNTQDELDLTNERLANSTNKVADSTNNLNGNLDKVTQSSITAKLEEISGQLELAELKQNRLNKESFIFQGVMSALGDNADKYKNALYQAALTNDGFKNKIKGMPEEVYPLIEALGKLYDVNNQGAPKTDNAASAIQGLKDKIAVTRLELQGAIKESKELQALQAAGIKDTNTEEAQKVIALTEEYEKLNIAKAGKTFAEQEIFNSKSPLEQIDIDEKAKLDKLNEWRETGLADEKLYQDALTSIQQEASEKRKQIDDEAQSDKLANTQAILSSSSQLFDGLAGLISNFAGESNSAYKALFAISKGFAIADAALKLQSAMIQAMADPTAITPAQKFANYAAVASAGGALISQLSSLSYGGGRENGGSVLANSLYQVGEKDKPELLSIGGRQYMIPGDNGTVFSNKDVMSNSRGGNSTNITVNVPVSVGDSSVSESDSKQLGQMIKQSTISIIQEQMRPGGLLNKR